MFFGAYGIETQAYRYVKVIGGVANVEYLSMVGPSEANMLLVVSGSGGSGVTYFYVINKSTGAIT